MTGEEDGDVRLEAMLAVDALLELDEMSLEDFGSALKAGDLGAVVIIRPDEEINSSSLLDEAVFGDTKRELNSRSGSSILRNPLNSYFPLVKEFKNVVFKDQPSVLPLGRGVRHEIDTSNSNDILYHAASVIRQIIYLGMVRSGYV
ncbi:reverse transcriptase [Plasmopara halstedii]|uniref:Reverse transcriptase n=1 Tax=Plasmopara halstedii TaxID=4781 RepID=A0A0N7L4J8_PLAHL|nr:reverse transcriptase [Plasmopara halstedii]CEG38875.1 reverse transcriptase [Plasmopara halstedii]|eukprot:XP_024575244.1 reverse transcriptase [Plasmopara halstedii]